MPENLPLRSWQQKIHQVIFEAETPAGKFFDVVLLWSILISVSAVCLESVNSIASQFRPVLRVIEWGATILFTIEYVLRIVAIRNPRHYILSFYGIIDLLSILPAYLSLYLTGTHSLAVIRALRLIRVFRIFKLNRFLGAGGMLKDALIASLPKITIFLSVISLLTIVFGSVMYLVEGPEHGFTSIPKGMYWTIVTMTTVGYGDISPQTPLGQFIASILMICGYAIIAIPTGIVTSELTSQSISKRGTTRCCMHCNEEGHTYDARFCRICGENLPPTHQY